MLAPWQLARLLELAWLTDQDMTMEELLKLIEFCEEKGYTLAASVLRDYLQKLTMGQRLE